MKNIKHIISLFVLVAMFGCSNDESDTSGVGNASAPTNLSALMTITQDNSGLVTIRPNGEGVTKYEVDFGDGSESETIAPGESVDHIYTEGDYNVTITAFAINGLTTAITQPLTVSFVAPAELAVVITPEPGNAFKINVQASALYETYFEVYFGEDPAQIPVQFNEGQIVSHTYAAIGTYEVRVVAFSGGVATSEVIQSVTIFDPLLLPVTFESATLNYNFTNFGNATSTVVNNPDISAGNPSSKVGRLTKAAGAEVWAGSFLELSEPIDFSTMQSISVKTWSPVAGAVVKLKLENLSNPAINTEVDAVTTVAGQWETLVFDFGGVNNANNYQRVVIFFDFGNNGNGANYYFDDIKLIAGAAQVELPLTFENPDLVYSFTNFGGAATEVVSNPDASGINTSSKVGQLTKGNGSEVWAGSFIELDSPIDFSGFQKIKVKTWSPAAGIVVKLKLENLGNASINTELDAVTTVAGGWEELTYDFTGINNANAYQRVVIFFAFGTAGTGANYYFDDIKLSN